ncbi:MAG: hypothetical protein V4773_01190 [Verrucomicrobiota bacterium]
MSPQFYYILHIGSLFVLAAYTFYAFAAPAETKKRVMMITGIASVLALVAGFALVTKLGHKFTDFWVVVKIVCWVGLSGLAGMGYKKRGAVGVLQVVAVALILIALTMVYFARFKTAA